jgi:hypothetical protein
MYIMMGMMGKEIIGDERTWSPSSLWITSHALCRASREVCEIAVEKMKGRAKFIKNDRIVGLHSNTAKEAQFRDP